MLLGCKHIKPYTLDETVCGDNAKGPTLLASGQSRSGFLESLQVNVGLQHVNFCQFFTSNRNIFVINWIIQHLPQNNKSVLAFTWLTHLLWAEETSPLFTGSVRVRQVDITILGNSWGMGSLHNHQCVSFLYLFTNLECTMCQINREHSLHRQLLIVDEEW